MKNGIAISAKLFVPLTIFCAMTMTSDWLSESIMNIAQIISTNARGRPMSINANSATRKTINVVI